MKVSDIFLEKLMEMEGCRLAVPSRLFSASSSVGYMPVDGNSADW